MADTDVCRFCRYEGTQEQPLYYPCVCTGSIKYIHQDCLVEWLKHSGREYCELCSYKFSFQNIYAQDMPSTIPFAVLLSTIFSKIFKEFCQWMHNIIAFFMWFIVLPLLSVRVTKTIFLFKLSELSSSLSMLFNVRFLVTNFFGIFYDVFLGLVLMFLCFSVLIACMWIKDQIMIEEGPEWIAIPEEIIDEATQRNDRLQEIMDLRNAPFEPNEPHPEADLMELEQNDLNHHVNVEEPAPLHDLFGGFAGMLAMLRALGVLPQNNNNNNNGNNQLQQDAPFLPALHHEPLPPPPPPPPLIEPGVPLEDQHDEEEAAVWNDPLTWARLFGFDGTFAYLEYISYFIVIISCVITFLANTPYRVGALILSLLPFTKDPEETTFSEGKIISCMVVGYLAAAVLFLVGVYVSKKFRCFKLAQNCGILFILIKVFFICISDVGIFPFGVGLWIDACSMKIFNASAYERLDSFRTSPVMFLAAHWMVGTAFIVYFASFLLILKDLCRPGLMWFFRFLGVNDIDYNPITEMIHLPLRFHLKRYVTNTTYFACVVACIIWIPMKMIRWFSPLFFPILIHVSNSSPLDYFIEIFFLQMFLPLFFDIHVRNCLKGTLIFLIKHVSGFLNLRSFIVGDVDFLDGDKVVLGDGTIVTLTSAMSQTALHNAFVRDYEIRKNRERLKRERERKRMRQMRNATGVGRSEESIYMSTEVNCATIMPYKLPINFNDNVICVSVICIVFVILVSWIILYLPITVGRCFLSVSLFRQHDLLGLILAFAFAGLCFKTTIMLYNVIEEHARTRNLQRLTRHVKKFLCCFSKMMFVTVILGLVVPIVLGTFLTQSLIIPLRFMYNKTYLNEWTENWMYGTIIMKTILVINIIGGPQLWPLSQLIENIQQEIMRRERLRIGHILHLILPILMSLLFLLCAPYILAHFTSCYTGYNLLHLYRMNYIVLWCATILVFGFVHHFKQITQLYEHVKNEKYLIGTQLVNYQQRQRNNLDEIH